MMKLWLIRAQIMGDRKSQLEFNMAEQKVLSDVFPEISSMPEVEKYAWRKQTFYKNEAVFNPGQPCNRFMLLGSGVLQVELQNPQGRSVVLYRIEPGQLCIHSLINLINDDNYSFVAIAKSDGWFCWADKEQFHRWMDTTHSFHQWILNNIGLRFKQVIERFAQHAFVSVEARLAGLLIEKMGQEQMINMTQSDLAAELGTAREIVSRYLSRWQKRGVVETRRGAICIIDIETLVDIAV